MTLVSIPIEHGITRLVRSASHTTALRGLYVLSAGQLWSVDRPPGINPCITLAFKGLTQAVHSESTTSALSRNQPRNVKSAVLFGRQGSKTWKK